MRSLLAIPLLALSRIRNHAAAVVIYHHALTTGQRELGYPLLCLAPIVSLPLHAARANRICVQIARVLFLHFFYAISVTLARAGLTHLG